MLLFNLLRGFFDSKMTKKQTNIQAKRHYFIKKETIKTSKRNPTSAMRTNLTLKNIQG